MTAAASASQTAAPAATSAEGSTPQAAGTGAQPVNPATNKPYPSASLYVGDLHPEITEGLLFEIFNLVGPVASIRVCRDAVTRRSLGYAYVNFHNPVDAERALDTMNNTPIKGRPCRIMWSQRDPSLRKSGVGNIFIKNLDKEMDHKDLYDTFSAFGNILSCKVVTDENNNSKGYGFVHYETAEAANKAIEKVNGMNIAEKKVFVGHFVPRKDRAKTGAQWTNAFVKNLPEDYDEEKLKEDFSKFGTISSLVIMKDSEGKSRCFGFVNFEKHEDAAAAAEALNGKEIDGKELYVGKAEKKRERERELKNKYDALRYERLQKYQGVNLYVKNLDDAVDDEKLREVFSPHGTITSCRVMMEEKNPSKSKGFGFVCFSTPEEATRAVTEMNGKMVNGKPLYVALAQRKEVRKAQLEQQFAQRTKGGVRGAGMPANGMYAGAPVFYQPPPGAMGGPQQNFVYPQQMVPRNRWNQPQQQQYQAIPGNYVVHVGAGGRGGRGGRGKQSGGRGGAAGRGGANAGARQGGEPAGELTEATMAGYNPEQQRIVLGERLYPLIQKKRPELAGKITGMLLDSHYMDEMFHLLENPEALDTKIQEAVTVLEDHASQQKAAEASAEEAPAAAAAK